MSKRITGENRLVAVQAELSGVFVELFDVPVGGGDEFQQLGEWKDYLEFSLQASNLQLLAEMCSFQRAADVGEVRVLLDPVGGNVDHLDGARHLVWVIWDILNLHANIHYNRGMDDQVK